VLRELKPGWNPFSFLYQSGQLVAAGMDTAKKEITKEIKKDIEMLERGDFDFNREQHTTSHQLLDENGGKKEEAMHKEGKQEGEKESEGEQKEEAEHNSDTKQPPSVPETMPSMPSTSTASPFPMFGPGSSKNKGTHHHSPVLSSSSAASSSSSASSASSAPKKNKRGSFTSSFQQRRSNSQHRQEEKRDQVFLVVWNELKKIGGDYVEDHVMEDEEDDDEEDCMGERLGKRKLKEDFMSCQQFMHLPEWLDIEIRPQRKSLCTCGDVVLFALPVQIQTNTVVFWELYSSKAFFVFCFLFFSFLISLHDHD